MLCALLKQSREEGCQRRYYEDREITNVIIMFPSDVREGNSKKYYFEVLNHSVFPIQCLM